MKVFILLAIAILFTAIGFSSIYKKIKNKDGGCSCGSSRKFNCSLKNNCSSNIK